MQKIVALLSALFMLFSFTACDGTIKTEKDEGKTAESPAISAAPELNKDTAMQEETPEAEEIPKEEIPEAAGETITGDAELDQLAELITSNIVSEDMDALAKARAVYDFVRGSINYSGQSDKSDWKNAAKEGLRTRQGDCYTYCVCMRALLTYLGIDNLEVRRIDGHSDHWWNLVNCGDGWYHVDATPMGTEMPAFNSFMFTDQQAAWYTELVTQEVGLTNFYSFNGEALPERAS